MRIKRVRHYILRDYRPTVSLSDAGELTGRENPDAFRNAVAFVSLLPHAGDGKVYCGITCADTDILHRFDPETKKFESLHYDRIAEPFEVKIHRSLELASDGTIYGASAGLLEPDKRMRAPGGSLFKLAPGADCPEKLAVPVAHDYIQTISLDQSRGLIYGQTYPVFNFFVYSLRTGATRDFGFMGSITHISAIDDAGCFWGTWHWTKHWFYKYDPAVGAITWFRHGLPNARAESNIMYPGAGPVDCMINGGDGYIYIGTCGGSLCRLDPGTAEVTYLGKPSPSRRLPGLVVWKDALLLGCAGDEEGGNVFAYDRETGTFHQLGPIVDSDSGLKLYRTHDLRLMNDRLAYVAETDVPKRSGYLWECELEL